MLSVQTVGVFLVGTNIMTAVLTCVLAFYAGKRSGAAAARGIPRPWDELPLGENYDVLDRSTQRIGERGPFVLCRHTRRDPDVPSLLVVDLAGVTRDVPVGSLITWSRRDGDPGFFVEEPAGGRMGWNE